MAEISEVPDITIRRLTNGRWVIERKGMTDDEYLTLQRFLTQCTRGEGVSVVK